MPSVAQLTSGQHDPVLDLLAPYSEFPKEIRGKTVWTATEYANAPERWISRWTEQQLEDLSEAADRWAASGRPLTEITKETFQVSPRLAELFGQLREDLINGKGFALIKGMSTDAWGVQKSATAYLGIGAQIGVVVSQNRKGHTLGHVRDLGNDPNDISKVRIYSTAAKQYFHTDSSDLVGLLCLARALEGGESDIVSAHHVWNCLQKERPDIAELLTTPTFHFDRKGEVSDGQRPFVTKPIYHYLDGKVSSFFDPYYVKSIARHVEAGLIEAHTPQQLEAFEVLEQIASREALHMILDVGDLQFVADTHVFHARTAYKDYAPPAPRRHLLRLWLATPESQGGWKLPYPDSKLDKRGGIQVNSQPETCPLEAE
ncbi:uncharacterized protein L969DRAFT_44919 [Mixia osmundae IAM 14324]|uniref:TauD/TfdA-like domain-containing protein n=1 Tax=Mixia osmundae (strain CBS 9802 / IAM 14324 / JCM 22182 / KY 12970) TaxID=764103 RepID=G7DYM9_MIXOS|nr:uncharacterized protein L969DRAFT_44919 [Mixia osmundae IAM 14324]KEI41588.1 hypothetical protein L969DRAFT_44919 [Mixia osmundae IAM 14324]GAA95689.1 hypothetical protein E5Q_02346 [Mixia osmundae IAM 14324]